MKERLKKFYHDHEEQVQVASIITLGVFAVYLTHKVTEAQNDIIGVASDDERLRIEIYKRNGKISPWRHPSTEAA